jgi:hypothetical protein
MYLKADVSFVAGKGSWLCPYNERGSYVDTFHTSLVIPISSVKCQNWTDIGHIDTIL